MKIAQEYKKSLKELREIFYSSFGEHFIPFLTEEYKKKLDTEIYKLFDGSLKYILENAEEYTNEWIDDISVDYIYIHKDIFEKLLPRIMVDKYYDDNYWAECISYPIKEYILTVFNYLNILQEE